MEKHKEAAENKSHKLVSENEWLADRIELLKAEKELTKQSDKVAQLRQQLPWVRVDKEYIFETDTGKASLADLFCGRSQLLIYHFMFGPDYKAGCPSCSAIADGFDGFAVHLANHDVMLSAVSRAPLVKLQEYKHRLGWSFPWASSYDSDFNFDFGVAMTEKQQREGTFEYNYQRESVFEWRPGQEGGGQDAEANFAAMCGTDVATFHRERPGMSTFVLDDGIVYHTYSTYARGLDGLWGMYQWLDRAPYGRNETGIWWKRHDEYNRESQDKDNSKDCCH
ncbi:thioredoxin family protein [Mucilaginibacter sabulilitoris]|uniref:Thioredoxin family protein n=1 Tax=Mucilaginibacter sabulilitoris TaxID=1173583 RepID=A0ABZ0TVL1_9SPHI|nr:thioredoxin family protein [Mucilaginibacter sabulilitoris]WPU96093.1 thioredoxin family protein [Mucilaginibacter sabulilitoris]